MSLNLRDEIKHLKRLSISDDLTGLPSREAFEENLLRYWELSAKKERPITLILIGLDDMGPFRELYGERETEGCLIAVSRALYESGKGGGGRQGTQYPPLRVKKIRDPDPLDRYSYDGTKYKFQT